MASGHVNRIKRPNTWLHRPMLQNVKKALANPEPSTHDPKPTFDVLHFLSRLPGDLLNCVPIMNGWNYIRPALPPAGRSSRRQVEISGG